MAVVKVRATRKGFYNHSMKRIGAIFPLEREDDFSDRWMERVDSGTPDQHIPKEKNYPDHDEEMEARRLEELQRDKDRDERAPIAMSQANTSPDKVPGRVPDEVTETAPATPDEDKPPHKRKNKKRGR